MRVALIVCFCACPAAALAQDLTNTSFSGTVDGSACVPVNDCKWSGTITLTGNVTIPAGVKVTVTDWSAVQFTPVTATPRARFPITAQPAVLGIDVDGTFEAYNSNIESARATPAAGDWGSLHFRGNSTGHIEGCHVWHGSQAIVHDTTGLVEIIGGYVKLNLYMPGGCAEDAYGAGIVKRGAGPLIIDGTGLWWNEVISCVKPDPFDPIGMLAQKKTFGAALAALTGDITIDNATFDDNVIAANNGPYGAALGVYSVLPMSEKIVIRNTRFYGNETYGGMAFNVAGDWKFIAPAGGAVGAHSGNLTIENCLFESNTVRTGTRRDFYSDIQYGSYDDTTADDEAQPSTASTTPTAFSTRGAALGASLFVSGQSTVSIARNRFRGSLVLSRRDDPDPTTVNEQYWCGGAAIAVIDDPIFTATNNWFFDHRVDGACTGRSGIYALPPGYDSGGTVHLHTTMPSSQVVINHNTFAWSDGRSFDGAALYADMEGPLVLTNNLFFDNVAYEYLPVTDPGARGVAFFDNTARVSGTSTILANDAFMNAGNSQYFKVGVGAATPAGNYTLDPGVVGPTAWNSPPETLYLTAASSIRDLGVTTVPAPTGDFGGEPRDRLPDIGFDELIIGTVTFSAASASGAENAGAIDVTATLSAPAPAGGVTIPFSQGGTASASDFSLPASFSFTAGATTATLQVTPVNDAIYEPDEWVQLAFSSATLPGGVLLGATASQTTTITNDDPIPSVGLGALPASVLESVGTVSVSVTLSNPSYQDVSATLVASGTASLGLDALLSSTLVTIPAGSTSVTVTLDVIDDALSEGTETLSLGISAPTNATFGAGRDLDILDDDTLMGPGNNGSGGGTTADADTDGDGLSDATEIAVGTDPFDADSDDDGLDDSDEPAFAADTDGDGRINARDADSDNDGLLDGLELSIVDPVADPDGDGFLLGTDLALFVPDQDPDTSTDPLDPDTDDGGVSDGQEDRNGDGAQDRGEIDPTMGHGDDDLRRMDLDGDGIFDLVGSSGGGACQQAGDASWLALALSTLCLRRRRVPGKRR